MIDQRDFAPVGYKRYNKRTGEEVGREHIVKGYEYGKGEYVVVTDEDFKQANVEATQTVEIVAFVNAASVAPYYFATPYYLEPGKRGEKGYTLLREVLRLTGRVGIANVVIRSRQHLAAVVPLERVLVMNTLRFANEIRPVTELALPEAGQGALSGKELAMAERLVDDMTVDWDAEQYRDTYTDDLMRRIEARIRAGETHTVTSPSKESAPSRAGAEVIDLVSLLRRSLEKGKGGESPSGDKGESERPKRAAARKAPRGASDRKTAQRKRA
jgi:DNA end-binding protein Ku